jgi:hypothetical protein
MAERENVAEGDSLRQRGSLLVEGVRIDQLGIGHHSSVDF